MDASDTTESVLLGPSLAVGGLDLVPGLVVGFGAVEAVSVLLELASARVARPEMALNRRFRVFIDLGQASWGGGFLFFVRVLLLLVAQLGLAPANQVDVRIRRVGVMRRAALRTKLSLGQASFTRHRIHMRLAAVPAHVRGTELAAQVLACGAEKLVHLSERRSLPGARIAVRCQPLQREPHHFRDVRFVFLLQKLGFALVDLAVQRAFRQLGARLVLQLEPCQV